MERDKATDTRDKLISATIESIYQHGYSDTTVTTISEFADTSVGTLHNHFTNKEDLLEKTMLFLLELIHQRALEGTGNTGSPRGKLWAIIESVLGDEQSEDKITAVWFSFWMQARYDNRLNRIQNIYNRRLFSNVSTYLRQILSEIGASSIEERVDGATMMLISLMHGVWISYAMREDDSPDLSNGRQLVWETLEMLLSRAREPLAADEATVATSATLLGDISIEIIAPDIKKLPEWGEYAGADMRVYIPHFRGGSDLAEKSRTAVTLLEHGLRPVVHLSARNITDKAELNRTVAGMTAVGVKEFLLLGGGEGEPVGEFSHAMQILRSGLLEANGVECVGFAGHPEDHPDQPREVMRQALRDKIYTAQTMGLDCYIITQFCFANRPYFDFLDWVNGQEFNVPVRLGIAGRVNAAKLLKFAAMCGIGRSLKFLKRQFSKTMTLANYSPEGLLAELAARIAVRNYSFPVGVHFYPFGAVTDTLALVSAAAIGSDTPGISAPSAPSA